MQRSALLVANGLVYVAFAEYANLPPYHGWIMAYSTTNVRNQVAVFNTTPNGRQGGIWQSGAGLAADGRGNVYVMSGNGSYDAVANFGNSFIKFGPHLQVEDWFTPSNWSQLFINDLDVGASGPMLFPNSNLMAGGGKQGAIYVLDRAKMGKLETAKNLPVQQFQATPACTGATKCTEIHSAALWTGPVNPILYIWGAGDVLRGFQMVNGKFEAFSRSSAVSAYPGGSITVSSLGGLPGTGIVWAATTESSALTHIVRGTLRAFDATNLSHELWNSDMNPARDAMGNLAKFEGPVVANGRVYVPTFSNQLDVYGLLSTNGSR
jgi:hypothetical protein